MKPTRNSRRLMVALRKLHNNARRKPAAPAQQHTGDNWQKFIEAEMGAFNRRLARIETLTYIVVILVVATDLDKAADLLRQVLKL
jgi:hypothetical protein